MVTIIRVLMVICLFLTAGALRASISGAGIRSVASRSATSRLQFGPGVSPGSDEFLKSMLKPDGDDIWTTRRRIVRSFTTASIKAEQKREEKRKEKGEEKELTKEDINAKRSRATIAVTAALVAAGGVVLRLGGRGALISVLGLDFAKDSGLADQLTQLVNNIGPDGPYGYASYVGFLALWIGAKTLCIDAVTIVLALSSGVIFHGVVQGTLASVVCGTLGSSTCFYLARTSLREKTRKIIAKKPSLRAIDRSVTKDGTGFKTVFTLRLSPLLPIPIAAYSYVFGATSIGWGDFLLGTSLGSIKPYALDAYLGLVVMGTLSGSEVGDGGVGDAVLLGVLGVVILVGSLATQVATQAWEETQAELAEEDAEAARVAALSGGDGEVKEGEEEEVDDLDFIDLIPLPGPVIKGAKQAYRFVVEEKVGSVWTRLEDVARDEIRAVKGEIERGLEVAGMGEVIGHVPEEGGSAKVGPYPGSRGIYDYELLPLNAESVGRYTAESILFSFVLLKLLGGGLNEDEKTGVVVAD